MSYDLQTELAFFGQDINLSLFQISNHLIFYKTTFKIKFLKLDLIFQSGDWLAKLIG
jgi:hypothetical protein